MAERFQLKEAELREAFEGTGVDLGLIDDSTNPDELAKVIEVAQNAGLIQAPQGLEILIYPNSVSEGDVALISVFSLRRPYAHVAASSEVIYKEGVEGEDEIDRAVETVRTVIDTASTVIPAVRLLEHQKWPGGSSVIHHAKCPRCGEPDQLRVEYRYDVLGLDAEGELALGDPERTALFCLACCHEIDRAEPVEATPPGRPHDGGTG